ncbi:MAG: cation:proton antiporter [Acidimicrobiales bacterium]|nr:cation:proton antiporter [Acidimicrobiales bacterium]
MVTAVELLNLNAPHGTAWELFVAAVAIVAGPVLIERLRVPGLIGLLVGGVVIGPHVLGVVPADGGVIRPFGDVGLLYLMFIAGLELDLHTFARYRRQANTFAVMSFVAPLALGIGAGLWLGYSGEAAVLLGAMLASHTLVTYPIIRRYGLAANRAVAVTVGATLLTDTLALVVLAVVAGRATGGAGGATLVMQVVIGLGIVAAYCFVLLPPLTRWYFITIGRQRVLRYTYALGVLLGGAALAEAVGIEPIVGAFFTGLALNRLVPSEGEFMEHIEFFGSALLIPIFLVSVGTVVDPAVIVDPGTIGIAVALAAACLGGKLLAAAATQPAFRFTWDEVGVAWSLSTPQAAGTLAVTFVGLEIGLFDSSTVNAAMLVIVITLLVSSAAASWFGQRVPQPPVDTSRIGRSVLLYVARDVPGGRAASLAARLAGVDGGVIRPVVVVPRGDEAPDSDELEQLAGVIADTGSDADIEVHHDRTVADGILHAQASRDSSLVIATASDDQWLPSLSGASHSLVRTLDVPVVFVRPGRESPGRVVFVLGPRQAFRPGASSQVAAEIVARLGQTGLDVLVVAAIRPAARLVEPLGDVEVVVADGPEWLATHAEPTDQVVTPSPLVDGGVASRAVRCASERGATAVVVASGAAIAETAEETVTLAW